MLALSPFRDYSRYRHGSAVKKIGVVCIPGEIIMLTIIRASSGDTKYVATMRLLICHQHYAIKPSFVTKMISILINSAKNAPRWCVLPFYMEIFTLTQLCRWIHSGKGVEGSGVIINVHIPLLQISASVLLNPEHCQLE